MTQQNVPQMLTIPVLRQGYETGAFTPHDVIAAILARSAALTQKHIFITPPSKALVEPYLAALPPMDFDAYPLWGIPFAIKDNMDLAGIETTAACPAYAYRPEESATVVAKLLAAGAIPIGKTNLDQFATGLVGTRSPYGEVENAYAPERISGGSSSGSAVSVACGLAAFALGTDTAGSGRVLLVASARAQVIGVAGKNPRPRRRPPILRSDGQRDAGEMGTRRRAFANARRARRNDFH